jgi:hypothetical protein
MAIKNTSLGGTDWDTPVARVKPTDLNDTFDAAKDYTDSMGEDLQEEIEEANALVALSLVPIGGHIGWLKTFFPADSGTTTSSNANHLIQSGQDFLTTVSVGFLIHNTTDQTFAYVTAVNSDTDLTLDADIMASSEAFTIYKTPKLSSHWVEMNGQTLSDAESIFDGATIPNLNGASAGTKRFIRGSTTSGTTGGSETHTHVLQRDGWGSGADANSRIQVGIDSDGQSKGATGNFTTDSSSTLPSYYESVMIMRVK